MVGRETAIFLGLVGARRLRAAKIAELEAIPVRVVKLTDAEANEAQVVELSIIRKCFLCRLAGENLPLARFRSTPKIACQVQPRAVNSELARNRLMGNRSRT